MNESTFEFLGLIASIMLVILWTGFFAYYMIKNNRRHAIRVQTFPFLHRLRTNLSDRQFYLFMGTGLIVSVAYMDPGNWSTNIRGGSNYEYDLLWVIWAASIIAMFFQYLSGKIGIQNQTVIGIVKDKFHNHPHLLICYWLGCELAILATDMAEFLGIVVALKILFGLPYIFGAIFAMFDVLLIMYMTSGKSSVLEHLFYGLVSIVGVVIVFQLFIAHPNLSSVIIHSVMPSALTSGKLLIAVGIFGATIMPHALMIHSWLIKNKIHDFHLEDNPRLLQYHKIDNIVTLSLAGLVNAAMLAMAAASFYQPNSTTIVTLEASYKMLIPTFGILAAYMFAIALLSAGVSSSITGTLAGQAIMEGLTDFRIKPWVRRLIIRFINVIPLTIALSLGVEPIDIMIVSQVLLSLLIPLPMIPIIFITKDRTIMKNIVNQRITNIMAVIFAIIIIGLNIYLLVLAFTGQV